MMRAYRDFQKFLNNNKEDSLVIATITRTEGSSYKKAGARKLIASNGTSAGLISGGCLEKEIIQKALSMTENSETHCFDTRRSEDRLLGYATGCEGILEIEFQRIHRSQLEQQIHNWPLDEQIWLHIIGAGPDLDPLHDITKSLGWHVTFYSSDFLIIEERQNIGWPIEKWTEKLCFQYPKRSALLLMSHHYPMDLEALAISHQNPPAYIGILGPEKRRHKMIDDLSTIDSINPNEDFTSIIRGPLGLPHMGRGENAIALSVVAELQKFFLSETL